MCVHMYYMYSYNKVSEIKENVMKKEGREIHLHYLWKEIHAWGTCAVRPRAVRGPAAVQLRQPGEAAKMRVTHRSALRPSPPLPPCTRASGWPLVYFLLLHITLHFLEFYMSEVMCVHVFFFEGSLSSCTQHNDFEIHPFRCMCQYPYPFIAE